ncbi:MAG: hypothetical protein JSR33_05495 [Proteobacteria bacterium]|nr:hypothetical protein [Pseudomonadota bacterium]
MKLFNHDQNNQSFTATAGSNLKKTMTETTEAGSSTHKRKVSTQSDIATEPAGKKSVIQPLQGLTILGDYYSFHGENKPIFCELRSQPLDQESDTYFSLDYREANENDEYRAIDISVGFDDTNGQVHLSLTLHQDSKIQVPFELLEAKVQQLNLTYEKQFAEPVFISRYIGKPDDIDVLLTILKTALCPRRCCSYQNRPMKLGQLMTTLYAKIQENYRLIQTTTSSQNLA